MFNGLSWQRKEAEDTLNKQLRTQTTPMIAFLANTPTQAKSLLHSLERVARGIALYINADKTEYMCFNQRGDISTLSGGSLKLVDMFTYQRSSVSSSETGINTPQAKAWSAIDGRSVIWKSDLTDKMKCTILQAAVVSILLYGWTTWTLTKRMEKKLDSNYTRMLRVILNKSWGQHPTKQQLYGYLSHITKTIQVRRTRHAGQFWRSRDRVISGILQWTPSHWLAKTRRPARTYIQHLCADIGCSLENLPEAMDVREEWRERVWEIRDMMMTSIWNNDEKIPKDQILNHLRSQSF